MKAALHNIIIFSRRSIAALIFILFVFLFFVAAAAVDAAGMDSAAKPDPGYIAKFVFSVHSSKYENKAEYINGSTNGVSVISSYLTALSALYALLAFAAPHFVPSISFFSAEKGRDLDIMAKHYRDANKIIVFAGSFDWIRKNENLKNVIIDLAGKRKIRLVSNRDEKTVCSAIGVEIFNIIKDCFKFNFPKDIRCSYVSGDGGDAILYRHKEGLDGPAKVFIIEGNGVTRKIVQMSEWFMEHAASK